MKKVLIAALIAALTCGTAFGWGREGHETIAKLAEYNLKPHARKIVEKYLDNHSIVYYAKWMDDYRKTKEYGHTNSWHTATVDENLKYRHTPETGDAIYGINQAVEILKNYKEHNDSTVAVNLKLLIHMIGDIHCPGHVYYDGRVQRYKVNFGGGYVQPQKKALIHTVWDALAIQATRIWGLYDWAWELDRLPKKEEKAIVAGTPLDWFESNAQVCLFQFELSKGEGEELAQDFVNEAMPLLETQILHAGLRLAELLNNLF